MEKAVQLYRTLAQIPSVVSAKFRKNNVVVSAWSQRNLEKGKNSKFQRIHLVDTDLNIIADSSPTEISTVILSKLSPSESLQAVIRDYRDEKANKQFLEIWRNTNLWRSVDLAALDVHGDVYADSEFGTFQWSPCETKLMYIAEKKIHKSEAYYTRKSTKTHESKGATDELSVEKGEEHVYRQDWGEQLVGKKQSVICIYDVDLDTISIVEGIPENWCPGQTLWSPNGDEIIGVAWDTSPRKLGLIFCTNRVSVIFNLTLDGTYKILSAQDKSVRSPRLSPDGKTLVWLERNSGGPHHSAQALMKLSLPFTKEAQPTVLIEVVDTDILTSNNQPFYGLYNQSLPSRCFTEDSKRIVFATPQRVAVHSYVFDIDSKKLYELLYEDGSQTVLDLYQDVLLVVRSNIKTPDSIAIAKLIPSDQLSEIKWKKITESVPLEDLEKYNYQYLHLEQEGNDEVKKFSCIYFGPEAAEKSVPLIVFPHGGPHSSSVNSYSLSVTLYSLLGFGVLQVNYRGSTGSGQKSVEFLPSRVGDADVKDCVLATQKTLSIFPQLDATKVCLVGGSHGGFLVTHLSGQYPDMFKAVVARNPVIDIASMYITSDIPDWCSVEAGTVYTQVGPISEKLMIRQRECSPIVHAHKVKAPTLLHIGSKDLRVPPSQGTEYYHRLIANGVEAKMYLYEDNHSLSLVPVEFDCQINLVLWLQKHIA